MRNKQTEKKESPSMTLWEGINGTFYYHVSIDGKKGLCGDEVMQTGIPLSAWGTKGNLNERYCTRCATIFNDSYRKAAQ
jgi:hypothetical protein